MDRRGGELESLVRVEGQGGIYDCAVPSSGQPILQG